MKTPATVKRTALVAALVITTTTATLADRVFTHTIRPNEAAFTLEVPARQKIRVLNFVQDARKTVLGPGGGTFVGAIHVSQDGKQPVIYAYASDAFAQSAGDTERNLFIAGPATISVSPIPDANLIITYRRSRN